MKHLLLLFVVTLSLFADFYLYDGNTKVPFTHLKNGDITVENLKGLASMQRSNESIQIINDEADYRYTFLNIRLATIEEHPVITVLRDHSDVKLNENEFITRFGDIHVKDGKVLQLFYLGKWHGIYLGKESALKEALETIKNIKKINYGEQELITNYR